MLTGDLFDDTDSDSLTHVSDGEKIKRSAGRERLGNHGLLGDKLNHGRILGFDAEREYNSDGTGNESQT